MQRWGISERRLRPGSEIHFEIRLPGTNIVRKSASLRCGSGAVGVNRLANLHAQETPPH